MLYKATIFQFSFKHLFMGKKEDSIQRFINNVGENIQYQRQRRGLTLEALGEDIGLDKANMFRIEQGKNITLLTLAKIAAKLDVNPSTLLKDSSLIMEEDAEQYIIKKRRRRKK